MTWLEQHAQEIANCIWRHIPDMTQGADTTNVSVRDVCEHGVKFVFFTPGVGDSNTVFVCRNGLIARTEDVELVAEFIMQMANAQVKAFHQGVESQD